MTKGNKGEEKSAAIQPLIEQLFAIAVSHHQRGQLTEAEGLYSRILETNPRHAESLHYAGVAALQRGHHQTAADLIERSLSLGHQNAEAHYHLGLAMAGLRRFEQTAAENRSAIALKPDYLEAHLNLGNALKELGQFDEAAVCYQTAIALSPNLAIAHYNLANVLFSNGDLEAAVTSSQRALALQPNFAEAQQNLGTTLLMLGRFDAAIEMFDAALAARPDFVEALLGRALTLMIKGNSYDALVIICRTLDIDPTEDAKSLFVECLGNLNNSPPVPWLNRHLIAAIREPWGRTTDLVRVAANAILATGPIADIIGRKTMQGQPFQLGQTDIDALASDELLLVVLENLYIVGALLELMMTLLRRRLLDIIPASSSSDKLLGLACTLARQCFTNEYVLHCTHEEDALARLQSERLVEALNKAATPDSHLVAIVAAYFPLHSIPGADRLLSHKWAPAVDALLTQQVREPFEERSLRETLYRLTPIDDGVSREVQLQYEENPYPRWTAVRARRKAVTLDQFIRRELPRATFQPNGKSDCDILAAGCGTGQEVIDYAQAIANANALAVDLSLSSLAYAKRKTVDLGIRDIEYVQGDILLLPKLKRRFDLVLANGVLHHMAEPFAAWRGLLTLVRPGGFMSVSVYSKVGRQAISAAREFIAERGFQATPDDIRRARQAIMSLANDSLARQVIYIEDFYCTSNCRDLLFHTQEHLLTIPQIEKFLNESGAHFLGFRLTQQVVGQYLERFPQDLHLTDLNNWHSFESDNPATFIGMYQFMIQMPPASDLTTKPPTN